MDQTGRHMDSLYADIEKAAGVVDWLNLRRNLSVGSCCVEHSAKIFEGRKFDATSTRFLIS
jgi:hypothetical protein